MTPRNRSRPTRRRTGAKRSRFASVLGIPVPLVLVAFVLAALLGVQLTVSLEQSTANRSRAVSSSVDSTTGAGKNSSGVPVVNETALGSEVQRLVDAGMIVPPTNFDATTCLRSLGIQESILIMEEVAWGADETSGWLLVYGPMDRETLRANGGTVSASVVRPECGSTPSDSADPRQMTMWSGEVMIGSI